MRPAARAALGAAGALGLQQTLAAQQPGGPARWSRTNYRGSAVSLTAGPALAAAAALSSHRPGALVAGLGAVAVGAYDDVAGGPHAKGLRGHLAALRRGEVTSGSVKVVALAGCGLAAGSGLRERPVDRVLGAIVVAGTANLLNLFDLRPGRALKVGLVSATMLREPGIAGACAALLPGDLGERTMLGDAGANALGALLGAAFLRRHRSRGAGLTALATLVGLTALSEVCSFSALIDLTPPLRWADQLGRAG